MQTNVHFYPMNAPFLDLLQPHWQTRYTGLTRPLHAVEQARFSLSSAVHHRRNRRGNDIGSSAPLSPVVSLRWTVRHSKQPRRLQQYLLKGWLLSNLLPGASWKKPPELMTLETCAAFCAGSKPPLGQYLSDGEQEEEEGKKWGYGTRGLTSDF